MKLIKKYSTFIKESSEFSDEYDIARDQLFGAKTTIAFDFNREFITDVESIKDLIEKYNHFYIKEKSWSGAPPPLGFIKIFNDKYSKKKNASRSSWYPTIDLMINTPDCGTIIVGFSIINKSYKLLNCVSLNTKADKNVLSEMKSYIVNEISQGKKGFEETIDFLDLDVENMIDWEWNSNINESKGKQYGYGCVMVDVPINNWEEILSTINSEDLYEISDENGPKGLQTRPHLTLFYGLHDNVTVEMVKSVFENYNDKLDIEVNGIDIFENDRFDVVKLNVKLDGKLRQLHQKLSEFPNSSEFDYKPHITIAYVKKGMGQKYINKKVNFKIEDIDEITYSMSNKEEFRFKINNINESLIEYKYNDGDNVMYYDAEWKLPTNPIREKLERDLNDILLDLTDEGYRPQIGGFVLAKRDAEELMNTKSNRRPSPLLGLKPRYPYIWIKGSATNELVSNTIDRIKDYLDSEGYQFINQEVINRGKAGEQIYIYFDRKEESLNENKMWYKTIPQILNWIESKSDIPWLLIDTETTGLGGPKVQQLTQVSAIATEYDFKSNTFKEIGHFDEKIKLTSEIKSRYNKPDDKTKWVLGFNHYGSGNYKYREELEIVDEFFDFISNYEPCLLVAQNAQFDMAMLGGRHGHKIKNEVFDTKMLIQLYFLPLLQKLAETDPKYKEMIDFIGTSERDGGLISSSMSKIGPVLGVNMSGYHDALTDCRLMMQMYQGMVDLLKKNQNVDISKYQQERIKIIRN